SKRLIPKYFLNWLGPTNSWRCLRLSSAMAAAIGLLAFVELLQDLSNHWRGNRTVMRLHSHFAFVKSSKRVLRLFRRGISGKPGCGSLLVFRPPLGGAGFARHRYGIQAGGMGCSGGSIDRVNHSRAKLRHPFAGKIECLFLSQIMSRNDPAID